PAHARGLSGARPRGRMAAHAGRGRCAALFFSSRRRHTSSKRDWSSDVCSSDLLRLQMGTGDTGPPGRRAEPRGRSSRPARTGTRSEERRVGKERGSRGRAGPDREKGTTSGAGGGRGRRGGAGTDGQEVSHAGGG